MGRHVANGRHICFAVWLREDENETLDSLLEAFNGFAESKSEQFRCMISELEGRLRRVNGHLELEEPEREVIRVEHPHTHNKDDQETVDIFRKVSSLQ